MVAWSGFDRGQGPGVGPKSKWIGSPITDQGSNAQTANEHLKGSSPDSQLYGGTVVHLPRLDRRRHSDRVLHFAVSSEDETPAQIAKQLGMACGGLVQE